MYHGNYLNNMQEPQGIETVPRITDHQIILEARSHHTRSLIRALQTFLGITILAGSCALPITSLIFAPELFEQGTVIRAKVDEQLTAATGILARIIHDASAASVDTRLRQAVSPFSPSTDCTSMPQGFTSPSARLASRLHAFATNRHEYCGLGAIAGNLFGKATKGPEVEQKQDTTDPT
jgi:hypothetical protein